MFKKTKVEISLGELCCTQYINQKRRNRMKWSIKNFGYVPEGNDLILISKDNEIIDGNHRYCALLSTMGGYSKIEVNKINYSKNTYYSVVSAFCVFLVFLIVGILFLIF